MGSGLRGGARFWGRRFFGPRLFEGFGIACMVLGDVEFLIPMSRFCAFLIGCWSEYKYGLGFLITHRRMKMYEMASKLKYSTSLPGSTHHSISTRHYRPPSTAIHKRVPLKV